MSKSIKFSQPAGFLLLGGICALSCFCGHAAAQTTEPAVDTTLSPFGIGSSSMRSKDHPRWIPQMTAIGIRNLRSCGTSWGAVEPEEGKWAWDRLDEQLNYLASNHVVTGGILYGSGGAWNTKDKRGTLPVNSIPAWTNYVTEVVKHANGRIKYWEVWNEPPNGTGRDQTPADYAKILVAAYDAAKAVDPTCSVGIAAKSVHITYLEQVIKAGGKGHFDYVTLHPYEVLGCINSHPGTESIYMSIAPTVRKMLAAQDPAKANIPIYFTEIGYDSKRSADMQGQAVVKAYTMGIAQGIACIQWFEGMDGDSGPMGLLDAKGTPRPAYTAMGQMIQRLGRHPTYLGWVLLNDKHYGFVFDGAKGTVLAAWTSTKTPDNVDFGQPVQIVDPLTGHVTQSATYALTPAPILVDGVPANLVTQAKSNKSKPFPWGGDYTDAKSVSVTMGEKNEEKGLHTQSADSIAADVVAYGGSARAGTIPGGNVFMVDPNFLSYTTTPIEISVVVRRNPNNDPAKLTLEYESTTGYKKAEVYEVPDDKQSHTATWKIDDAQFVGTWAFNFRFNSGKYYIQSVTVTKLDKVAP